MFTCRYAEGSVDEAPKPSPKPGGGAGFNGRIHDEVAIHFISVNFSDPMDEDQVEVKFYSNGTSDEFTIGMRHEYRRRGTAVCAAGLGDRLGLHQDRA